MAAIWPSTERVMVVSSSLCGDPHCFRFASNLFSYHIQLQDIFMVYDDEKILTYMYNRETVSGMPDNYVNVHQYANQPPSVSLGSSKC
jgi:hypothetical protein